MYVKTSPAILLFFPIFIAYAFLLQTSASFSYAVWLFTDLASTSSAPNILASQKSSDYFYTRQVKTLFDLPSSLMNLKFEMFSRFFKINKSTASGRGVHTIKTAIRLTWNI